MTDNTLAAQWIVGVPFWAPPVSTLQALAAHYLDRPARTIGEQLVNKKTGLITYRRTAAHFASLVVAEYPYTADKAIEAYHPEQKRRERLAAQEWRMFFARLRAMSDDELITYVGGRYRRELSELTREGAVVWTAPDGLGAIEAPLVMSQGRFLSGANSIPIQFQSWSLRCGKHRLRSRRRCRLQCYERHRH